MFAAGSGNAAHSVIAACGPSDAPAPTAAPATGAPAATATPQPAAAAMTLEDYAAKFAGGPGAIYLGDLNQLVGPAPSVEQGDFDGNVPLDALERHDWIYESDFYQQLLDKAKLLNPTEMVYDGDPVTIQHACINRALLPCVLIESFFAPNLEERTNGKLIINVSSYPELGLAGPDTLTLVSDGTLEMANIYGGYVGGGNAAHRDSEPMGDLPRPRDGIPGHHRHNARPGKAGPRRHRRIRSQPQLVLRQRPVLLQQGTTGHTGRLSRSEDAQPQRRPVGLD